MIQPGLCKEARSGIAYSRAVENSGTRPESLRRAACIVLQQAAESFVADDFALGLRWAGT